MIRGSGNQLHPGIIVVAHVVSRSGGQERVTAIQVEGLLNRGYRVELVTIRCDLPPHPLLRVRRVFVPERPSTATYLLFMLSASIRVWLLNARQRHVIHAAGPLILNTVDVVTVHFFHRHYYQNVGVSRASRSGPLYALNEELFSRILCVAEGWLYRNRTGILCPVSSGIGRELEAALGPQTPMQVIPNGVDTAVFKPDPDRRKAIRSSVGVENSLVAVFVGGDWARKGLATLIDGISQTSAWKLLVIGSGDERRFADYAMSLGVRNRVVFAGPTDRVQDWLLAGDVYVTASAYEAFSLAMLEGAACGLPILSGEINGTEHIVTTDTGLLLRPCTPETLARALLAMQEPSARAALGAGARRRSLAFTWRTHCDEYATLYKTLAKVGNDTR